jgi:hypothetical protein
MSCWRTTQVERALVDKRRLGYSLMQARLQKQPYISRVTDTASSSTTVSFCDLCMME